MVKKSMEASGLIPEGTAAMDAAPAAGAAHQTQEASKRPIWTRQINRVESSMWKRTDQDGQASFSTAIFRSYFDKKTKATKRHHYYDEQDLDDLIAVATDAKEKIRAFRGVDEAAIVD
jgi:hypothetical protein